MPGSIRPTIDHFEAVAPDRIQAVQVDGRDCFAFTVKPGDVQTWDAQNIGPGGLPNQRAEISYAAAAGVDKFKSPYNVTAKTGRRLYDFHFKFADGYPMDQRWATILQFHWADVGAKPGFGGISVHGNSIDLLPPNGDRPFVSLGLVTGRWYDLQLDINWTDQPDGYVKLLSAGQRIGAYSGPTTGADTYQYLKQGYYRDGATRTPGTIYQELLAITVPDAAAPVILPPAPPVPAPVPPVTSPAVALFVTLRQRLALEIAAAKSVAVQGNAAADALQRMDDDIHALLDRGAKWNDA